MNKSRNLLAISVAAIAALGVAGCGGARVLKEPKPLVIDQPLAVASDQRLSAQLDWVIVRSGPGTWAKNADWDEYLIRVQNLGDDPITVTRVIVVDSLGARIKPSDERKTLVKGARDTKRRYKDEKLKVKAGASARTLFAGAALAGAATTATVMSAAGYGLSGITMSTGAATVATGGLILVPVFAAGGIMRGVNNGRVDDAIELRHTKLPVELQQGEETTLDVFFPLAPSPRQVEFTYADSTGQWTLVIDTSSALDGLHLAQAAE